MQGQKEGEQERAMREIGDRQLASLPSLPQNRDVDPQLRHSTEPYSSNSVTACLECNSKSLCRGGMAVGGALQNHSPVKHTKLEKMIQNNHLRSLEIIIGACSK